MPLSGGTAGAHDDSMHQGSAKRDVAGGVAGLDAAGDALVAAAAPRTISAMKDDVDGIAGLDSKIELDLMQMRISREEYSSHLGENEPLDVWTVAVVGNGVNTRAYHTVYHVTGVGLAGLARLTSIDMFGLSTAPMVLTFRISLVVDGVGGLRKTCIGFRNAVHTAALTNCVMFYQDNLNDWYAVTAGNVNNTSTAIAAIAANDIVSIIATLGYVKFYVNGFLVAEHTTNITGEWVWYVSSVVAEDANVTSARGLRVGMVTFIRYV